MLIDKIYKKFHTPKHVISHMKAVKRACEALSYLAKQSGHDVDSDTLYTAALIHDALRVCDFSELSKKGFPYPVTDEDIKIWEGIRGEYGYIGHSKALSDYLEEIGEKKLANLVFKHDFKQVYNLETLEEKILYYADKRVEQDEIVDLSIRLEAGGKRNLKNTESPIEREKIIQTIFELEEELAQKLGNGVYNLQC